MKNENIRYIASLILIVFGHRVSENTKTQSSCQLPSEMQRYNVDVHKLIYGAVKPAEGKKCSMGSKSFFHGVYRRVVETHRMKSKWNFLTEAPARDHAIWEARNIGAALFPDGANRSSAPLIG